MKNLKKIILILFVMLPFYFLGQPPNPTGNPNDSGGQELGGNAPIGEGIFILFSLGVAYAGRKTYLLRKRDLSFRIKT